MEFKINLIENYQLRVFSKHKMSWRSAKLKDINVKCVSLYFTYVKLLIIKFFIMWFKLYFTIFILKLRHTHHTHIPFLHPTHNTDVRCRNIYSQGLEVLGFSIYTFSCSCCTAENQYFLSFQTIPSSLPPRVPMQGYFT